MKLVAVDIGGTSTRFALAESKDTEHSCPHTVYRYKSQRFTSFDQLLSEFLIDADLDGATVDVLCLASPGVIIGHKARLTNLSWDLDANDIRQQFGIANVVLINDYQAACEGLDSLEADDIVSINAGQSLSGSPRVITGIGTGLGMAWQLSSSTPQVTEGGHIHFSAMDTQQDRLLKYLRVIYPQHVSYERILSGAGLVNLYQFILTETGQEKSSEISPASVSERAELGEAEAVETMRLFVRILAGFTGNLAVLFQPFAGLYIGGGMTPKIYKWLKSDQFMEYYSAKGRMSSLALRVPVILVMNEDIGLLGALSHAYNITLSGKR